MASQPPPTESEAKVEVEDEEAPADAMERFNALARGLLTTPREPVMEAERKFKARKASPR